MAADGMVTAGRRPIILGHRGASADAPENTLAAFRLAIEQGADGIELDVWRCGSGEVVVHHDADTSRTAGMARRVSSTSWAELRCLDVGSWKGGALRRRAHPAPGRGAGGAPLRRRERRAQVERLARSRAGARRGGGRARRACRGAVPRLVLRLCPPGELSPGRARRRDGHPLRRRAALALAGRGGAPGAPPTSGSSPGTARDGGARGALARARAGGERLDRGRSAGRDTAGRPRRREPHHESPGGCARGATPGWGGELTLSLDEGEGGGEGARGAARPAPPAWWSGGGRRRARTRRRWDARRRRDGRLRWARPSRAR